MNGPLSGLVDLHLHSGPDLRPRVMDDVQLAQAARQAGYRAVLLKSHHTLTADRAQVAARLVPGIGVYGGLALNRPVGGINPDAVETALAFGARQIWFPTISATVEAAVRGVAPVAVLDQAGALLPAVHEVLALIAQADVILGTGHLAAQERWAVVRAARAAGVQRLLITHPEHPLLAISVDEQHALAGLGARFERCFCFTVGAVPGGAPKMGEIAAAIRAVGVSSTVLSTDLGRADLPHPIEGFASYLAGLQAEGFAPDDLHRMACDNPAQLLGL